MIGKLSVTVITDNRSVDPRLSVEHGLAVWIDADGYKILFDTGQSAILLKNAGLLGIDITAADALVLSHGHYDHAGGVADVLKMNPSVDVYCHNSIFLPRYSRKDDGTMQPIGIGRRAAACLHAKVDSLHWTTKPVCLTEDVTVTGTVPRITEYEDAGGHFFLDCEGICPDRVEDDCSLLFKTVKGLVVVTGCCHSGLVNTLEHVRNITGNMPIHAVIGGFHLLNAQERRLMATCEYLERISVHEVVPCHCTGRGAVDYISKHLGDVVREGGAGIVLNYEAP